MPTDHRSWAAINLGAFAHNLKVVREYAGNCAIWPVLKANAYGHGAVELARTCESLGVERIGVGDSNEALELRAAGVRTPLVVLGTVIDPETKHLLAHDIEVGVHSQARALQLGAACRQAKKRLGVHLKLDTGMGRLGVLPEAAVRVAESIRAEPWLELEGVMTHFASPWGFAPPPGETDEAARNQDHTFRKAVTELEEKNLLPPHVHCANSAALLTGGEPFGNAVRPGIALFGVLPLALQAQFDLQRVLSLHSQIVFLIDVPLGTPVGYGGQWTSEKPTRLAILPLGYNDGVPYRLGISGQGEVLVRGQRCPIVGAVSMDYCTIDVTHVNQASLGDTATLIGTDGRETIRVQDVAAAAGTIPYEITCSIGSRVQRICHPSPKPSAVLQASVR
ncbi:MAG: alanine racemase [Planctomycetes bacterium]|nr:alanine racemase [Planctomycetota bacterium]